MDYKVEKVKQSLQHVETYLAELDQLTEEDRITRYISYMLPTTLLSLSDAADAAAEINDSYLQNAFLINAKKLIEQEAEYDPNPGKTRSSVSYIKQNFPELRSWS